MQVIKSFLGIADRRAASRAEQVAVAADELTTETRELNRNLQPYRNADDPFKALLIDLSNKRAERYMRNQLTRQ